ncbi:MAG: hypothetical protein IKE59_04205 [Erysipelotrichaceae bacterium]|nr:hypothetical protein [Erysipelotrichaceae bacterium]
MLDGILDFFAPLVEEITSFLLGIGLTLTFVKNEEKRYPVVLNLWSYRMYILAFFLMILAVSRRQ